MTLFATGRNGFRHAGLSRSVFSSLVLAVSLMGPQSAQAVEAYGAIGVPGLILGVAQPINEKFTARADYGGLVGYSGTRTEDGIRYDASGKLNRLGLFGDWFAFGGGFRFTGGLTVNRASLDLHGQPEGSTISIGDNTYTVTDGDRFEARVEYPTVMPYLGIGWGHQQGERGWGFNADLGVSFGSPTVTVQAYGALASQPGVQEDIARETAELEDNVGKVRAIPQLTIGVNYRF